MNNLVSFRNENVITDGYFEINHNIPLSEGGLNIPSNKTNMYFPEHVLYHWLRWAHFYSIGDKITAFKNAKAVSLMTNTQMTKDKPDLTTLENLIDIEKLKSCISEKLKEDYKNGIGNLQNIEPSGKDKVWITDGTQTKRIKKGEEIPNGFKIGRLPLKILKKERKKYVMTDEHRKNISKGRTGMKFSEEHVRHMSEVMIGHESPMKGKNKSNSDTVRRVAKMKEKEVMQFTMDYKFVRKYSSVNEAIEKTGFKHISCCCNGRRNSTGGYIFVFALDICYFF